MSTLEIVLLAVYWVTGTGLSIYYLAHRWGFVTLCDILGSCIVFWMVFPIVVPFYFSEKIVIWGRKL